MFDVGVEYFISEVKRHPVLWDTSHRDFNNRHSKLSAWVDVATRMYTEESETWSNYDKFGKVRELQKRWKNLRDSYMREVKYRKRVEKGFVQPKKKKYIYSDLLTFLTPGTKKSKSKSQSSSEQSSSEEESNAEESNTEVDQEETNPETHLSVIRVDVPTDEAHQNNTTCKSDTSKQETSYVEEYLKQQQYTTYQNISEQNITGRFHSPGGQFLGFSDQAELDDDKMFLLSLLPYFKKLEGPKKLQARITITKFVHDFLYNTS